MPRQILRKKQMRKETIGEEMRRKGIELANSIMEKERTKNLRTIAEQKAKKIGLKTKDPLTMKFLETKEMKKSAERIWMDVMIGEEERYKAGVLAEEISETIKKGKFNEKKYNEFKKRMEEIHKTKY